MADRTVGQRLRDVRRWRDLTQREAAELAGFTGGYLSLIERGLRPIDKRSTLEALAGALRVAPSELTGGTYLAPGAQQEHAALVPLRLALANSEFGEPAEVEPPGWPVLRERLVAMNALRGDADYVALGATLPPLIPVLHGSLTGPNRRVALVGLADCYEGARAMSAQLGVVDLSQVASMHLRVVVDALSGPEWVGLAAWSRAHVISSTAPERALAVATRAAAEISSALDDPAVAEVYGSLHLAAAWVATTLGRLDVADMYVAETAETAAHGGSGTNFANLWFGRGNVQVWRVDLAVERGEGSKAVEIARATDPAILPRAASRRSAWWSGVGRGLAMERRTWDEAVRAFRTAEEIAPQRFRTHPLVREVVIDMRRRSRRDGVGRELRGLAHRMGIAV